MSTISTTRKTNIIKSDSSKQFFYDAVEPYDGYNLKVYVNSQKLPFQQPMTLSPKNGCFVIYIDAPYSVNTVNVSIGSDTLQYTAQKSNMFERYDRVENMMDDATSFMLLRANPKLTGNVKVVVDSDSNMYMDTFKVSKGLSQQKYRKIPINPEEYYGRTLMAKFRDMPIDDFYKIEDSCYDLFTPANTLDEQYYDKYNCGVRTNDDRMYSENFSILAPLCIRRKMPDFFLVFKVKNYEENLFLDSSTFKPFDPSFILDSSNCEIIKCFDMREGTGIGTYIRDIYENSKGFVGDAYAGEDSDRMNVFHGISVERGVVAKIYESGHEADLVTNQVAINDHYTRGFERNHIVSKDIVNFEFMFDDPSEKLFSINQYYGIYVKLNGDDETFSCIDTSTNGDNILDTSVGGPDFDPSQVDPMIYGISTPYGFERMTDNVYESETVKKYKLTPHKNVATLEVTGMSHYRDGNHAFASVQLNDVLDPGEHYRIIDKEDKKIYDVIVSNAYDEDELSDFSYDVSTYNDVEYDITRISILNTRYRKLVGESEKEKIIGNQARLIAKAFNSFDTKGKFVAFSNDKDVFSVVVKKTHYLTTNAMFLIEKVQSFCGYNDTNIAAMSLEPDEDGYIEDKSSYIFGLEDIERFIVTPENTTFSLYYPRGFECMGDRFVQAAQFLSIPGSSSELCPTLVNKNVTNTVTQYKTVIYPMLYPNEDRSYDPVKKRIRIYLIARDANMNSEVKNVKDCYAVLGFGDQKNYYMIFGYDPMIALNDKIFLYQNYPMNVGVCSIFQIKDMYNTVLDNSNQYMLSSGTDFVDVTGNISRTRGEYQTSGNIFSQPIAEYTEENFTNYVDKLNTYIPRYNYKLTSDASFGYYLHNLIVNDHTSMDIAITVPNCCKWKTVGTDHCGNRLRLMYNLQLGNQDADVVPWRPILMQDIDSYWIPKDTSTHIGLLSASMSNNTSDSMNKYIRDYNSFNDYETFSESIHSGTASLEDMMFYNMNQDCRFSKAYDCGDDAIEFVSGGAKIRLKSSDKSKLNMASYVGYSAMLVCMNGNNPRRPSAYELFIDENTEQMALFAFNGIGSDAIKIRPDDTTEDNFEVKHATSMYKGIFNTETTSWDFLDDGFLNESLWDFDTDDFKDQSYGDYKVFLLSIPHDTGIVEDPYAMVTGNLVKFVKRDDIDGKIYMRLRNVEAYRQGEQTSVNYATNSLNVVDMYVVTTSSSAANASPVRTLALSLEKLKSLTKSYSVFIKKQGKTLEYDDSDRILQIRFVEPFYTQRRMDSSIYSTFGLTHPSCIEPVTTDILPFTCYDSNIQYTSNCFNRCLNAANLIFEYKTGIIDALPQTWLRKVIDLDAVMMGTDVSIGYEHVKIAVYYHITTTDGVPDNLTIGATWTDFYGNTFILISVDYTGEPSLTYQVNILPNELLINQINPYEWSAYNPDVPSTISNATFNGSLCTPHLTQSGQYYNGYIDIPSGSITSGTLHDNDQFRIVCTTYEFTVHESTNPNALSGNNVNTRFFAYNAQNQKIADFGTIDSSAPFFDGYNSNTGRFSLRMKFDTPFYETPSYFLRTDLSPDSAQQQNERSSLKIYVNEKYQILINHYPDGRSNLVHFTAHPIVNMETYSSVTLTFMGSTPDTPMPEEYPEGGSGFNVVFNDEFKIPTTGRIQEDIYEDSSVYNTTYLNTTGLTLYRGVNPIIPYWYTRMCRLFNKFDNYVDYFGAFSGYEKNTYLGSRAITLKTEDASSGSILSEVTIDTWFNTKSDAQTKTVKLDITESLTELINTSEGYSEAWSRLTNLFSSTNADSIDYTTFKTKYIANTILKFIVINNKAPFTLYVDPSSTSFMFNSTFQTDKKFKKVENMSTRLTEENGRYYMTIRNLEPKQYCAKMEIKIIDE